LDTCAVDGGQFSCQLDTKQWNFDGGAEYAVLIPLNFVTIVAMMSWHSTPTILQGGYQYVSIRIDWWPVHGYRYRLLIDIDDY